jgi:isopenicillin-N N-acyltransferase like protein
LMWVSANPFQLGAFNCYDINKVFKEYPGLNEKKEICEQALTIPADPFLKTAEWQNYLHFKMLRHYIVGCTKTRSKIVLQDGFEEAFIASNPESYITYWVLGDYYAKMQDMQKAISYYKQALTKEVATQKEAHKIAGEIKSCEKKIAKAE